jgi:uncharacterized membrane protein YbaN (DUF454 family)
MLKHIPRLFFLVLGWLSLGLGVLGIFLPLLPTTPFVLLAAYCFSKSSERWHAWLRQHPFLGPLVKDWEAHHAIRTQAKLMATLLIVITFALSLILTQLPVLHRWGLSALGVCVLLFIWTRPTPP